MPPTAALSPLPLYQQSLEGDTAAYADAAFGWLRAQIDFDAAMLVTTHVDRPAFLDAHFTGFADVPALMASWAGVAHLDVLAPRLVAEPGTARPPRQGRPLLAGPEFAPLHAHLERFGFQHTLCIALPGPSRSSWSSSSWCATPGQRGTAAELALLGRLGARSRANLLGLPPHWFCRLPATGLQHLSMARINA